jgi:hypothetical protein
VTDVGREVAPGARLLSVTEVKEPARSSDGVVRPGPHYIVIEYEVHGCRVRIRTGSDPLSAGGAIPVHVEVSSSEQWRSREPRAVTTEVMRAIPLQDARRRLRQIQRQREEQIEPDSWYDQDRLSTEYEWAAFSRHYAATVESGERSPIMRIAAQLHASRHTVSARVRRAREKGLLTHPTPESLGQLTDKARRILREQEG